MKCGRALSWNRVCSVADPCRPNKDRSDVAQERTRSMAVGPSESRDWKSGNDGHTRFGFLFLLLDSVIWF
jgi:hypothetical protein